MVHFEKPSAWIFESPIDERHAELCAGGPMAAGNFGLHWHVQFMLAAVQKKKSMHLQSCITLCGEIPGYAIGAKNNFAKFPALEHVLVHFSVAAIVPALAAGGVSDNFAAGLAGCWISSQAPAFQRKRPVHRVQGAAERPMNGTLRAIQVENDWIGGRGGRPRRSMLRKCDQHGQRDDRNQAQVEDRSQAHGKQFHSSPFRLMR